ncbi:hypothetical protein ADK41_21225 [Streptomyces caelestis]|uniref:Lipoprotein n=2 Tax=Streptomyces TaxID=1883 RepID=A0A0M8QH39_9ACTN|nr:MULTISPECIES: hypothetical protein [Streptomyces]KOT37100.1 hypothetical protein ADK41_21225 [Streptomyces caelestis]KOV23039.1 hypothetical protein ADK58_25925 [Streptomyces sp. XY152]
MRRSTLTAAALATLFLAAGCSDEPESEAKRPSPTAPTASSTKPTQAPATQPPSLDLPKNAQTLVPETTGNKDQELPEFTPQEGAYTLYATCEGKGKMLIVDRDSSNPHPVTCNGVHTVGVVHEDKKPQHLTVQVTGGTSVWRIAVVSGNHQP